MLVRVGPRLGWRGVCSRPYYRGTRSAFLVTSLDNESRGLAGRSCWAVKDSNL